MNIKAFRSAHSDPQYPGLRGGPTRATGGDERDAYAQAQQAADVRMVMADHHPDDRHVFQPTVVPPDYDEDPNNWTARVHPPHAFAKNALRPIYGKDDPRPGSGPGGYP